MSEQVTVAQLNEFIEKLVAKEAEIEAQAEVTKKLNKEYAALEGRVVAFLNELGQDVFVSPHGTIKIEQKWSVNLPKSMEDKQSFFDWLRERGIFEQLATVNANTLKALYNKEWQQHNKQGGDPMLFTLPGIGAPTLFEKPKLTKPKGKKS